MRTSDTFNQMFVFVFSLIIFYIIYTMNSFELISLSRLKSYSKLLQKKYRQSDGKFLVEGVHLVEEALKSDWEVEAIVVSDHGLVKEIGKLENWNVRGDAELFECTEKEFGKLTDTVTSQGIVAVVKIKKNTLEGFWEKLPECSIIIALDDVSDPGNIGTILRTCDWFGVNGVLLSENSVGLYNSKVIRSTMGAIFHLPVITDVDLGSTIKDARKSGFNVITTVLDGGKPLSKFSFTKKSIIVFGNEAHGISKEIQQLSGTMLTIPKYGKAESLNVGISCGIILNAIRSSIS